MEARQVDELPRGEGWQYEPKWDGFRCIARRDGRRVELLGRSGKTLARYFPEVVEALARLQPSRFVLDGELVIPTGSTLSFEALQMRLHPAESRIRRLSDETPALLIAFDMLQAPTEAISGRTRCASGAQRSRTSSRPWASRRGYACRLPLERRADAQTWLDAGRRRRARRRGRQAARRALSRGERAMLKIKCLRTR